ncbi:hypothetical protein HCN44_008352 [Aphidius gifuensis]|uniref:Uncharacterized protein n=2 Tax=Aphidius gifuensis TaxID=684658 RepID=A0A834XNJ0_APHGI|nr:hypothetical protein HCN44_008352 [Aphidius gifuensis]
MTMTKYEKIMEKKLNEKLEESIKKIKLEMNDKKKLEVKFYMKKLDEKIKRQIIRIENDYEKKFKNELDDATVKLNKKLQKAVVQTRINVTNEMMKKLRDEIEYVVNDLDDEYQRKLCAQKDTMVADFNQIMRHVQVKTDDKINSFQQLKCEEYEILRVQMENKNIDNVNKAVLYHQQQCEIEKLKIRQGFEVITEGLLR